jgi:hypothetical protein
MPDPPPALWAPPDPIAQPGHQLGPFAARRQPQGAQALGELGDGGVLRADRPRHQTVDQPCIHERFGVIDRMRALRRAHPAGEPRVAAERGVGQGERAGQHRELARREQRTPALEAEGEDLAQVVGGPVHAGRVPEGAVRIRPVAPAC